MCALDTFCSNDTEERMCESKQRKTTSKCLTPYPKKKNHIGRRLLRSRGYVATPCILHGPQGGKKCLEIAARVKGSSGTRGIKGASGRGSSCTAATTMRAALALLFLAIAAAATAYPEPTHDDRILGKATLPPSNTGILVV